MLHRHRARQQGLTLVELLVSIVIMGFVMTLVSQAIFQVSQVTRAADATTRGLTARWGAGWTASAMFANMVAPEGSPKPVMRGAATRVEGFTTAPLDGTQLGVQPFVLELRPAADRPAHTELVSVQRGASAVLETASAIAAFPGRAEFAFIGRDGQTVSAWPALTRREGDAEDLPKIVLVRDAGSGAVLMMYGFQGEATQPAAITSPFGELP